mmetsp:Transcript_142031/g.258150  ORF Transcript_142031/g.258150 Transcript_142031/m.258150 type:complete len:189 (-) Transcript_142031:125-691(-)
MTLQRQSSSTGMSWDRGAPSMIVPNPKQGKKELDDAPKWRCECGTLNPAVSARCSKCFMLQKEEREERMRARAVQGLGRGGGYFERDEALDRDDDMERVKGGVDIYGRVRTEPTSAAVSGREASSENSELRIARQSKTDKQKAALERLRAPKKRAQLSPPRPSHFREKSSRSRSREMKRERKVLRNHG